MDTPLADLLATVAERAAAFRMGVGERRVFPSADDLEALRAGLGELGRDPQDPAVVISSLADLVEPALVATPGPRYFGFVIGGALDAATAADMLSVGWDQNAFNAFTSPAAAVVEDVVGGWLKELLGLPAEASFGFVPGGQVANTVGLAAARHHVLSEVGWDVESLGLCGGPPVRVLASVERHVTIDRALRFLGLGTANIRQIPADDQGAIRVSEIEAALVESAGGPTIVCLQVGNVNSGACDDVAAAVAIAHDHGAWVHVDGAFGLWAAANPATRRLTAGLETADSWAVDGHKWLNVPHDSGYMFCAYPEAHRAAMVHTAAYLTGQGQAGLRSPGDYVMESSRRARGFATWAALRQLGSSGVAAMIERCCSHARRFAHQLAALEGVTIGNEVVLNQVLVRFGDDDTTDRVVDRVQQSGECWMGGTSWHGHRFMRISVSNWTTTEADVDRSVTAIADALAWCRRNQ